MKMPCNSLSARASCVLSLLLILARRRDVSFPRHRAWLCCYSQFPGQTYAGVLQPRFAVPAGLCWAAGTSLFLKHPRPGLWGAWSFDLPWEVPLSWWGCFDVLCSLAAKSFCWRCSAELLSSWEPRPHICTHPNTSLLSGSKWISLLEEFVRGSCDF